MADEGVPAKRVDEDWKKRVAEEKRAAEAAGPVGPGPSRAAAGPGPAGARPESGAAAPSAPPSPKGKGGDAGAGGRTAGKPDPRFLQFLQGIAAQALMAMGQIEGLPEPDMRQAKMVIDTLVMLEEKTRGNLSREEEQAMRALLQELQSIYVQMAG
jgi:hypothetical protein